MHLKMIFGSPGTGKTRALTSEIQRHIDNGVPPDTITAISYSRAAAKELAHRTDGVLCTTVHALALDTLRRHGDIRKVLNDDHYNSFLERFTPVNYRKMVEDEIRDYHLSVITGTKSIITDGVDKYIKFKVSSGVVDFTDMLLTDQLPMSGSLLVVDEAQDLSLLQLGLISAWMKQYDSVVVCGDPDQSIYTFAGAHVYGMAELAKIADEVISLDVGYRVPSVIKEFAMSIIERTDRYDKAYSPARVGGEWRYYGGDSNKDSRHIIAAISSKFDINGTSTGLFLARTNSYLDYYYNAFRRMVLPSSEILDMAEFEACYHLHRIRHLYSVGVSGIIKKSKIEEWMPLFNKEYAASLLDGSWLTSANLPTLNLKITSSNITECNGLYISSLFKKFKLFGVIKGLADRFTVSTIHGAKGMEADEVFIILNSTNKIKKHGNIHDERRLAYVAVTRAKEGVSLFKINDGNIDNWCMNQWFPGTHRLI